MYRLFVDEVGNSDLKSSDSPNHRYLSLTGIIMSWEHSHDNLEPRLARLKQDCFGTDSVVLHRSELVRRTGSFQCLEEEQLRNRFDDGVMALLTESEYSVITAVIDKHEHRERYQVWRFHPYHYCMTVLLERYVQWLERRRTQGDVMAESRGKRENRQLERAYKFICKNGSDYVPAATFESRLTSSQLKLKPKSANVAALQMADLIAHPSFRFVHCEKNREKMTAGFGKQVAKVLYDDKYLRSPKGVIKGWGTKWLP